MCVNCTDYLFLYMLNVNCYNVIPWKRLFINKGSHGFSISFSMDRRNMVFSSDLLLSIILFFASSPTSITFDITKNKCIDFIVRYFYKGTFHLTSQPEVNIFIFKIIVVYIHCIILDGQYRSVLPASKSIKFVITPLAFWSG